MSQNYQPKVSLPDPIKKLSAFVAIGLTVFGFKKFNDNSPPLPEKNAPQQIEPEKEEKLNSKLTALYIINSWIDKSKEVKMEWIVKSHTDSALKEKAHKVNEQYSRLASLLQSFSHNIVAQPDELPEQFLEKLNKEIYDIELEIARRITTAGSEYKDLELKKPAVPDMLTVEGISALTLQTTLISPRGNIGYSR